MKLWIQLINKTFFELRCGKRAIITLNEAKWSWLAYMSWNLMIIDCMTKPSKGSNAECSHRNICFLYLPFLCFKFYIWKSLRTSNCYKFLNRTYLLFYLFSKSDVGSSLSFCLIDVKPEFCEILDFWICIFI